MTFVIHELVGSVLRVSDQAVAAHGQKLDPTAVIPVQPRQFRFNALTKGQWAQITIISTGFDPALCD